MKWKMRALYVRIAYALIALAGLVAAAAAGWKWC